MIDIMLKITALAALLSITLLAFMAMSTLSKFNKSFNTIIDNIKNVTNDLSSAKDKIIELVDGLNLLREDLSKKMVEITDLKNSTQESLQHFNEMSVKVKNTSEKVEERMDQITGIFKPFEILVESVYDKIAQPVNQSAHFIGAAVKAIGVFVSKVSNK